MTRQELLKAAVDLWGVEAQVMMAIEEMAELTQALSKSYRSGRAPLSLEGVVEEIADVRIMLDQLVMIFDPLAMKDCSVNVECIEKAKLIRLARRLGTTYEATP